MEAVQEKEQESKEEEGEEEEDALAKITIASVVEQVVGELKRSPEEAALLMKKLSDNWIENLSQWQRCNVDALGLPAFFVVRVKEIVEEKARLAQGGGPGKDLECYPEEDEEDKEQNRVVREMAAWIAGGEPNKTIVKVYLNALSELDTAQWSIKFDLGVQLWFHDKDHIDAPEGEPNYDNVWKPELEFVGAKEIEEVVSVDTKGSYYIRERYRKHGIVNWYQRFRGCLHQELELHKFPFDQQVIRIRFGSTLFSADDVALIDRTDPQVLVSFGNCVDSLHEWALNGEPQIKCFNVFNAEDRRDISYVELSIPVRRRTSYYVSTVFLSVFFLEVIFWWTFIINPDTLNDRLGLCITCYLALVAFNFVVAETLPKISHTTYLSIFFLINYAVIGLCAVESGISFLIDRYLPVDGFNTAKIIDWTFMGCIAVAQSAVMIFFMVLARRRHAGFYKTT